ncbi:MAG: winged helix-turn-helix transcriptional regulator [Ruminococcaceae bacterium]|nr:winged helix-turn-helix transcriptional regulator [Oscillospiraceae bacterium]
MKTVYLFSQGGDGEREALRMLELELTERGIPTAYGIPVAEAAATVCLFAVYGSEEAAAVSAMAERPAGTVIVTAREAEVPLPSGAVYVERPFSVRRFCDSLSLIAADRGDQPPPVLLPEEGLLVDRVSRTVTVCGETVSLTEREYALLDYLDRKRGTPVSREEALREVWGFGYRGNANLVDVYIRYLRRKIDERFDTRYLVTVRERGYMLRDRKNEDDR